MSGILVEGGQGNEVEDALISDSGLDGIQLKNTQFTEIERVQITHSGHASITLVSADNTTIEGSKLRDSLALFISGPSSHLVLSHDQLSGVITAA